MGRVLFLLLYIPTLLIGACSINKAFGDVKESKKIHHLTSVKYVVKIVCAYGQGTGVIFDGKVLTAAHVVKDSYNCVVSDYKGNMYQSYPEKINEHKDLAILKPDRKLLNNGIRLGIKELSKYDEVYTIGFPIGLEYYLTKGEYQYSLEKYYFTNIPLINGNSGGPLFAIENGSIRLHGIAHAVISPKGYPIFHLSSFINLATIREFINE